MPQTVYRFHHFVVDASTHAVWKNGVRLPLQEQPYQVLLTLLENAGSVVTRETLRLRLWGTNIFVDFDQSLNSALRRLRLALEDNSRDPVYVETIPRVGFRFRAEVAQQEAGVAALASLGGELPGPAAALAT
jgi:DNA-binding winged helix-turn-helix (wHTH) protein